MGWNQKFQYDGVNNFDCSATNLYDNQEMVCIGQLTNACDAGQMSRPGEGMLLADDVNLFVSTITRLTQKVNMSLGWCQCPCRAIITLQGPGQSRLFRGFQWRFLHSRRPTQSHGQPVPSATKRCPWKSFRLPVHEAPTESLPR